jgi:hypothetical protein
MDNSVLSKSLDPTKAQPENVGSKRQTVERQKGTHTGVTYWRCDISGDRDF